MEGRAARPVSPRVRWAWLVPWFSGGPAAVIANHTDADRTPWFLAGLVAGVAWQLLYRRDLTDRLTFMSVVAAVGIVAVLIARTEFTWDDMDTAGLNVIGIVLGLVFTEQWLRRRDRLAIKAAPLSTGGSV